MHDASGPVPPQPIPHRRQSKAQDRRMAIIYAAVVQQGAAYNPQALAEETGLSVDAIRRFAAQVVVTPRAVTTTDGVLNLNMVELGMIAPEQAIRMGSEGLAASLRIAKKSHMASKPERATRPLRAVDLMGMRRMDARAAQDRCPVVPARTSCPRCGAVARADGGCAHQRLVRADETTIQGLPHV